MSTEFDRVLEQERKDKERGKEKGCWNAWQGWDQVPCTREKCQLWNAGYGECYFRRVLRLRLREIENKGV